MYQGQFFPIDKHGLVGNPTRLELVPPVVSDLVPELVRYYQTLFGESLISVCLRGSAARGQWVSGVSDLDTVAIVRSDERIRWQEINGNPFPLSPIHQFSNSPMHSPPAEASAKECLPFPVEYIRTDWFPNKGTIHPRVSMVLKTQSLPVWGEDIRESLPPVPLSLDLVLERRWVESDWSAFRQKPTPDDQQQLIKTLLRARGGSLLVGEGRFSPDLDLCAAAIKRHKPALTAAVDRVVSAFLRKQEPNQSTTKNLEGIYQLTV